ncbi:hypothetical protein P9139_05280 [Curtobacterium flaccumfaciens]|nr:hypothetical protein P9139_05280 [Curtobacterium flaccumfaciens]
MTVPVSSTRGGAGVRPSRRAASSAPVALPSVAGPTPSAVIVHVDQSVAEYGGAVGVGDGSEWA